MRTKYTSATFLSLLFLAMCMSSCLKSDDKQPVLSANSRIEKIGIAPIEGHKYIFSIDQVKNIITNNDSVILPKEKKTDKLQISIDTLLTGAYVAYGEQDSVLFPGRTITLNKMNESGSLYGVRLKTLAADRTSSRSYSLQINVHLQNPDEYSWTKLSWAPDRNVVKAIAFQNKLLVCGENNILWADGQRYDLNNIVTGSIQSLGGVLYANDSSDKVYKSSDGENWTLCSGQPCKLIGVVNGNILLGFFPNKLFISNDGIKWSGYDMPSDMIVREDTKYQFISYKAENRYYNNLLIIGDMVWFTDNGKQWAKSSLKPSPMIIPYNNNLYFIDGEKQEILVGLALKTTKSPILFNKGISLQNSTVTVDDNSFIYVISDGTIWKGRLNKLGFKK